MWSKGSPAVAAVVCAVGAMRFMIACSDSLDEQAPADSASTRQRVLNGIDADPGVVKQVKLTGLVTQGSEICPFAGSGSLLTNNWILTAAHVIDGSAPHVNPGQRCVNGRRLADTTTVDFGSQSRSLDRIDVRMPHPRYQQPNHTDMALIHVTEPFQVDGSTTGYSRAITNLSTLELIGRTTRCFGYGLTPSNLGTLHYGDFRAVPPFDHLTFSIVLDGIVPGSGRMIADGDSGGGCVDLTARTIGRADIFGINREVDDKKNPREGTIQAADSFRDFARASMTTAAPRFTIDLDQDGDVDLSMGVQSVAGFFFLDLQDGNGAVLAPPVPTFIPDTPISNGVVQSFVSLGQGDFNGDGTQDILALGGGLAYLYNSALGSMNPFGLFNSTPPAALRDNFTYASVQDFNQDGFDDVEAVRSDGSSVLLFGGPSGLGPAAPALSRGPDFDGDGLEDVVVAAVGDIIGADPEPGEFHVLYADGTENVMVSSDFHVPPQTGTDEREAMGVSLSWGNFDDDPTDEFVAYLRNPLGLVEFDYGGPQRFISAADLGDLHSTSTGVGVFLSSGDVDGDGIDDIVISRGDVRGVRVLFGREEGGFDANSRRSELTAAQVGLTDLRGLETGDFNCDGREDVAMSDNDKVAIVNGSSTGLVLSTLKTFTVSTDRDSNFDQAMAAGNFNGDTSGRFPCADLAIAAGREPVNGQRLGVVHVLYGGTGGLTETGRQKLSGCCLAPSTLGPFPQFGGTLAISRLNRDGFDDLMVGWEQAEQATGAVFVYAGSSTGIRESSRQIWRAEVPSDIDSFGGGLGGTSNGFLVVGSPFAEGFEGSPQLGRITMIEPNESLGISRIVTRPPEGFHGGLSDGGPPMMLFGFTVSAPRPGVAARVQANRQSIPDVYFEVSGTVPLNLPFASFDDVFRPWTSSVPLRPDFQNKTQGQSSLVVDGSGKITLKSPPFSTTEFAAVGTQISVDVFIPADKHDPSQPNKIEMSFSAPSAGITNVTFGTEMHVDWKQGQWNTVNFAVPENVMNALRGEFADAQFAISFHTSKAVSPLAFDNLRFTGGIQPR